MLRIAIAIAVALVALHLPPVLCLAVTAGALCAAAGIFAARYRDAARRGRALAHVDQIPAAAAQRLGDLGLGDAVAGVPVAVSGVVACDEPLTAPVSGEKCAAYRLEAEVATKASGSAWHAAPPEERSVPFWLVDGSARVRVLPEGARLLFSESVSRRYAASAAKASPLGPRLPEIDAAVPDASQPTAYRARESLLRVGAEAHVWATLQEHDGEAALGAGGDHPGAEFLISDAPQERLRRQAGYEGRRAALSLACCLALASLTGWRGVVGLHLARFRGPLHVRNESDHKFTIRLTSGRPEDGSWAFDPHEGQGTSRGKHLTDNDRMVLCTLGDRLTVSEWEPKGAAAGVLGATLLARWNLADACWEMDVKPERLRAPESVSLPSAAGAPASEGWIYARNLTQHKVTFQLTHADGTEINGKWTFAPQEGQPYPAGVRLIFNKAPVTLAAGALVSVSFGEASSTRVYRVGDGAPIAPRAGGGWLITIEDALPPTTAGRIRVRNQTPYSVRLVIRRPNGRLYGTSWDFDPYEHANSTPGANLQMDKKDVLFFARDLLQVTAAQEGAAHPLIFGRDRSPVWRPADHFWLLQLPLR